MKIVSIFRALKVSVFGEQFVWNWHLLSVVFKFIILLLTWEKKHEQCLNVCLLYVWITNALSSRAIYGKRYEFRKQMTVYFISRKPCGFFPVTAYIAIYHECRSSSFIIISYHGYVSWWIHSIHRRYCCYKYLHIHILHGIHINIRTKLIIFHLDQICNYFTLKNLQLYLKFPENSKLVKLSFLITVHSLQYLQRICNVIQIKL